MMTIGMEAGAGPLVRNGARVSGCGSGRRSTAREVRARLLSGDFAAVAVAVGLAGRAVGVDLDAVRREHGHRVDLVALDERLCGRVAAFLARDRA